MTARAGLLSLEPLRVISSQKGHIVVTSWASLSFLSLVFLIVSMFLLQTLHARVARRSLKRCGDSVPST